MRLFVGVELGETVRTEAARLVDDLRRRASTLAPRAHITWVSPERIHVTVRFIGHVDDARGSVIAGVLEPPIDVEPFELVVAGTGAFPDRGAPRVIWAGLGDGVASLEAVERAVTSRLTPLAIPPEDRPYRPHVTLARVKEAGGLRVAALLDGWREHRFGVRRVDAITLFESRLSLKGPTYVPLHRTALR
jgi:2'-5' RNA ligase